MSHTTPEEADEQERCAEYWSQMVGNSIHVRLSAQDIKTLSAVIRQAQQDSAAAERSRVVGIARDVLVTHAWRPDVTDPDLFVALADEIERRCGVEADALPIQTTAEAVAAEREECALTCDRWTEFQQEQSEKDYSCEYVHSMIYGRLDASKKLADMIRKRGEPSLFTTPTEPDAEPALPQTPD